MMMTMRMRSKTMKNKDMTHFKVLDDNSPFVIREAYRLLRANIQFLCPHDGCRTICITSSIAHEGKSTVSYNLSSIISDGEAKVLFIDGDMRASYVKRTLGIQSKYGLSDILGGIVSLDNLDEVIVHSEDKPNLDLIVAGKVPPNPSELLASERMAKLLEECRKRYDYIIIDGTPVCLVSDVLVLSPYVDGYAVVVRADVANKKMIRDCISKIKRVNGKVLGFVLSAKEAVNMNKTYYGHYGSYR